MKNSMTKITSKRQATVPIKDLMDYVGFLGNANLPDDEEDLLNPAFEEKMLERE